MLAVGRHHQLSTHLHPCSSFPQGHSTVVSGAAELGTPMAKQQPPCSCAKDFCPSSPRTDQVTWMLFEQLQVILNINLEVPDMTVHI